MTSYGSPKGRQHILTFNLEDYFQVGHLSGVIPQRYWDRFEKRVEQSTLAALDLLDEHGAKATFFTVGWIADQARDIVAEVARRGHEVASKGYLHRSIGQMSPEEFRADAVRSRIALERACGHEVQGYRIARGWYTQADLWALDILAEEGFTYDSSLRPFGRVDHLTPQDQVLYLHHTGSRQIWVLPISSWWSCGFALPISGGNYIRQLPHALIRHRVEAWHRSMDSPLVFYFHVWELDQQQPRIRAAPWLDQLRHYRNLDRMRDRITYYLSRYAVTSADDYLSIPRTVVRSEPHPEPSSAPSMVAQPPGHDVTVVVPCFNEVSSLPFLKRNIDVFQQRYAHRYNLHFIFVDDGSTDETFSELSKIFGGNGNCFVIRHDRNCGVGAATLTGIKTARTAIVCVIDCDCSYDIEQLARFIPLLGDDTDLVTASPYHRDGEVLNVPGWRVSLSRAASLLYRQVLHTKLATYTACFRAYRRDAVADLQISNGGFLGIAEILALMDLRGARIVECPAVLEPRLFGQSKMKVVMAVVGHLRLLMRIGLRRGLAGRGTEPPRASNARAGSEASAWSLDSVPNRRMATEPAQVCRTPAREETKAWHP